MDEQFPLRDVCESDCVALAKLYQKTFREIYIDDLAVPYSEHDMKSFFQVFATSEWFSNRLKNPRQAMWVIEDKTIGESVAFAVVGPCTLAYPEIRVGEDGEIIRLYVRSDRKGRGLGKRLMYVALSWLEQHYKDRPIWIGILATNVQAETFYQHYGFKKVGHGSYNVGQHANHSTIMRKENSYLFNTRLVNTTTTRTEE